MLPEGQVRASVAPRRLQLEWAMSRRCWRFRPRKTCCVSPCDTGRFDYGHYYEVRLFADILMVQFLAKLTSVERSDWPLYWANALWLRLGRVFDVTVTARKPYPEKLTGQVIVDASTEFLYLEDRRPTVTVIAQVIQVGKPVKTRWLNSACWLDWPRHGGEKTEDFVTRRITQTASAAP